jgi:hypothetical protein
VKLTSTRGKTVKAVGQVRRSSGNFYIKKNTVMLNEGSTALPFVPYKGTIATLPISEKLRAFLEQYGYGLGINNEYYNYIDFERKVFVQNVYRKVFNGTEDWYIKKNGTINMFSYPLEIEGKSIPSAEIGLIISLNYSSTSWSAIYRQCGGITLSYNGSAAYIHDSNYRDGNVDDWKAHLAELHASGNPLTIFYALATPIEIDISEDLPDDNFIEV